MKSYKEFISEAKKNRAAFGTNSDGDAYAVNIAELESNEFLIRSVGQARDDEKKVAVWKKTAKKGYVDAKGKPTLGSVRKWVKANKPSEFYAKWPKDTSSYKDDSVEIYYK